MLIHRGPKSPNPRMQAPMHAAAIAMVPPMNGGKDSLFHVFRANVLTLHDVNNSPGYQGIEVFE
jgi:hypothetical protein